MDQRAISRQLLVEHEILGHVTNALRATVGWKYPAADFTRKLDSLRFVVQSYQRHLNHLMELEEENGYMTVVVASRPELTEEVETLRHEHGDFRKSVNRIRTRLRIVQPTDQAAFAKISEDLLTILEKMDGHSKRETDLLQHALLDDEGGEG
jgi:hemerythrin-like domain-containing protein